MWTDIQKYGHMDRHDSPYMRSSRNARNAYKVQEPYCDVITDSTSTYRDFTHVVTVMLSGMLHRFCGRHPTKDADAAILVPIFMRADK
jgi:hypothetical protein